MHVVTMPQLGETVTEGTVTRWCKQVGEHIEPDEALFEVSTDKVDTEVPVLEGGWVRAHLVAEGATVSIGAPIAIVTDSPDEPIDAPTAASTDQPTDEPTNEPTDEPLAAPGRSAAPGTPAERSTHEARPAVVSRTATLAASSGLVASGAESAPAPIARPVAGILSPAVRALLADHGLDASEVVGSGRDGRITRSDVVAAARRRPADGAAERPAPPPAPTPLHVPPPVPTPPPASPPSPAPAAGADDDIVEFTRARRSTAEHMVRSLHTSAHTLVGTSVDYGSLDPVRAAVQLSYLPFVARAVIDALRDFPHLNASVGDDSLIVHRRIHLGIAVDVDHQALVVPVVHDADALRLRHLSDTIADLAARARSRRLSLDELSGGTFTITNVGRYGTTVTAPVINQPQVAILSIDGVRMTPVAVPTVEGTWAVAIHPVGNLSLSFDHRAVDGAYAAAFVAHVRDLLETRDWSSEVAR